MDESTGAGLTASRPGQALSVLMVILLVAGCGAIGVERLICP